MAVIRTEVVADSQTRNMVYIINNLRLYL